MKTYLKIENPGVVPVEGLTLMGATTKRGNEEGFIGCFGTGNKYSIALLLRHGLNPIIFSSTLRMDFFSKEVVINDGITQHTVNQVCLKFGGKDSAGTNRSSTEDLGFTTGYGEQDWRDVALAMREFISNAIDHSKKFNENQTNKLPPAVAPWFGMNVEIVEENQVRAKKGVTRIFIPVNEDVSDFFMNIGKWFLHFSEPNLVNQTVLSKAGRNLNPENNTAVIYRCGVRVREMSTGNKPSLFDYNLSDLKLDESRQASDYDAQAAAGRAIRDAEPKHISQLIKASNDGRDVWELTFSEYSLANHGWSDTEEKKKKRESNWQNGFRIALGTDVVAVQGNSVDIERVKGKGFRAGILNEALMGAARAYNLPTVDKVLSDDEKNGRVILPTISTGTQSALDRVWSLVELAHMAHGKDKPGLKEFKQPMDGGKMSLGFYKPGDDFIYINHDIAGIAESTELLHVVLEETAHYLTGASDCSRDFQEFFIRLCVAMMSHGG